jgi:outer membrane receptor protein involved in Fe transport
VAPNGKRFYVGKRCDLETYSAVIVDEHSLGPLNLDLGLRWIRTFINNYGAFNINESPQGLQNVTPIKDMWEPAAVVANAGAAYDLSRNVSLHFNLSSGNIGPERGDLDVNLREPKVERRIKLDLGIKLQKEKTGQVTLAFFLTRQKNALVLSGKTVTVAGRVLETYLNRNQRQNGIEIDLRSSPFSGSSFTTPQVLMPFRSLIAALTLLICLPTLCSYTPNPASSMAILTKDSAISFFWSSYPTVATISSTRSWGQNSICLNAFLALR